MRRRGGKGPLMEGLDGLEKSLGASFKDIGRLWNVPLGSDMIDLEADSLSSTLTPNGQETENFL